MKFLKITPSVYSLSMGYVKVFLIKGEKDLCLIDTGLAGRGKKILNAVEAAGLNPEDLKHIIITHLHQDHTGSLHELKDLTRATVYSHEAESEAIEKGLIMRHCTAAPGLIKGVLVNLMIKGGAPKKLPKGTWVEVKLTEEELPIGPGLKVIATPGHTAGHISILVQEAGGVLITGDAASGGKRPGYPMLFEDQERGVKTLSQLGGFSFDKALFSHGKSILSGASELFRRSFS